MLRQCIVRIAGHEQHFSSRSFYFDLIAQFLSAHLRHNNVGNDQVEVQRALEQFKRFDAIGALQHIIAAFGQHRGRGKAAGLPPEYALGSPDQTAGDKEGPAFGIDGSIAAGLDVPVGVYTDTVTANIEY